MAPERQPAATPRPRPTDNNPMMAAQTGYAPEQIRRQTEDVRAQTAFYEQKQAEWSEQHKELQQLKEDKSEFAAQLDEVGMKIHNVVRRLAREIEGMEKEKNELRQIYDNLTRHLQVLSSLDPSDWTAAGLEERLLNALSKLDRAENDLNEAYLGHKRYRYTQVFELRPNETKRWGVNWGALLDELKRGFFFHLPLSIILSFICLLWYCLL